MSEESPLFPLKSKELTSVSISLFKSAFPISVAYLTGGMHGLLSFVVASGRKTDAEFSGFAYGHSLISLFCLGLFLSIDQGFAILASKLFGAKKYQEMGILYQRNLFISTIIAIPMILAMLFSDSLLKVFGVNEDITVSAGVYLRSMIPSIIGTYIFSSTRYLLMSQNIFGAPTIILLALLPFHFVCLGIFDMVLEMGIAGVGFAKSLTDITAAALLFLYFRRSNAIEKETWVPWTKECLQNVGSHLKRTLMLGATSFLQLIVHQLSFVAIVALNNFNTMGAHCIAIAITTQLFAIPLGISLAMQAKIGNAIGEGYRHKVQKIMAGGIILNLIFSLIAVFIILGIWGRYIVPSGIFDRKLSESFGDIVLICLLAHIFDSFANIIGGALRAVGKERKMLVAFLLCYFVIGLTSQWFFGVHLGYGYIAVWLCIAGTALLMCMLMVYAVWTLDWKEQIRKVKRALDYQIYAETQSGIQFADMVNERKVFIEKAGEDETKDSIDIYVTEGK